MKRINSTAKSIITNFSYAITSNLVSLIISMVIVLVIPKLIGVTEYGYWQLYAFYTSYLGILNIGWVEGIYLRYGGEYYDRLDKNVFASQFWTFFLYIISVSFLVVICSLTFVTDDSKKFIFQMTALCLVISVPRGFLYYLLQTTNRVKEYSRFTLADRIIYIFIIVLFLFFGIRDYKLLILADLIAKTLTFIGAMYLCRDILFSKMVSLGKILKETKINISVGIKLMFANFANMLILGIVRFGIERSWDIETFGMVSLALSISNLLMLFINSVGMIVYPILRRTNENNLSSIYITFRNILMAVILGTLVFYYPLYSLLSSWLSEYADGLKYMAILFPIVIFEGKMSLLINTYFKTLRKEQLMLKVNVIVMILSFSITIFTTLILHNLNLTILSITVLLAIRCIIAEIALSKIINISVYKDIILDVCMVAVFIFTAWKVDSILTPAIYGFFFVLYLLLKRKDLMTSFSDMKLLIKS